MSSANLSLEDALRQAVVHHQAGRLTDAERMYRAILAVQPELAQAHNNLGIALAGQGKLGEAVESYSRALACGPSGIEAHIHLNLGNALYGQDRFEDAAAAYRRVLEIAPGDVGALYNLASLLMRETALEGAAAFGGDRIAESFACFERHAQRAYGDAKPRADAPPHKRHHDREQRDYLADIKAVNLPFQLGDGGAIAGPAVNPRNDIAEIERQWTHGNPKITVIDNLLTPEALEKLQRYCWSSTVWRDSFSNGYLAALPEHGLACPLLAQIADELRTVYPAVFHEQLLRYLWAFKYDSRLSGAAIHADQAAINVNFWITPDAANLEPGTGGLIIWDKVPPPGWNFEKYNGDVAATRDFLARSGAKPTTVAYRANRAVIFDSDLFHETDRIVFKDGYLNRRINVTLLYGARRV